MPTKVAIVGAGQGATWLEAFSRIPDVQVSALIALPDDTRRHDLAQKYSVPHEYDSLDALLRSGPVPDAVVIATPPNTHVRLGCQALEAGAHALIEKPPALSADGARRLFFRALAVERTLAWGFCNRHARDLPPIRPAVQHVHVSWKRGAANGALWALDHDAAGGGVLLDYAIHGLDLALLLTGYSEPRRAYAEAYDAEGRRTTGPIEHRMLGTIVLRSGQKITFDADWTAKGEEQRITFEGPNVVDTLDVQADDDLFWRTAAGFLTSIYTESPATQLARAEQGITLMRLIDALYQSARTGQPISLV